jgi:RHS repeat-associated protein
VKFEIMTEMNASGTVTATNTWGANGLVSRRVGTTSTFYVYVPQGSVAQRVDASENVVSSDLYDAYGNRISGTTADPVGYCGQWGYYTDSETGLALCTYRYYDPTNGRWVTRDPIGYVGGVNLYGYVSGNPVNRGDPSGLSKSFSDCWHACMVKEMGPSFSKLSVYCVGVAMCCAVPSPATGYCCTAALACGGFASLDMSVKGVYCAVKCKKNKNCY